MSTGRVLSGVNPGGFGPQISGQTQSQMEGSWGGNPQEVFAPPYVGTRARVRIRFGSPTRANLGNGSIGHSPFETVVSAVQVALRSCQVVCKWARAAA